MLSRRVSSLSPSVTLGITTKAKQMVQAGLNVINLGAGEPDFDTPEYIKNAAQRALDEGFTKYTPTSGIKELKDAICYKFKKENNLQYQPDEILVSCGAKHSIFNAIVTLCDEDDEVLLPAPYWVSYPEIIKLSGAKVVILKTTKENNFKITSEQLRNSITKKTKLFILNSPANPTGMVYTEDELKSISDILVEHNIYCISDEIYEKIIYENEKHISIASFNEKIKNLTIVVNGVSKSYCMTGWRLGYAAGPKDIIQAMSNLQDHSTSNPTSFAQVGALEALRNSEKNELEKMCAEFKKRRDYIVNRINSIKGLSTLMPKGAFYCFVDISQIFWKKFNGKLITDSVVLSELLLSESQVAVIPGLAFGDDNFIRLSYATSMENIVEGLNRIEKFTSAIN